MTDERRYGDEEVREIFKLAATPETASLSESEGLSLEAIQEIGREIGLAPEVIARAAATVDVRGTQPPPRTSLGMPVEVGRILPLPRALTDAEWERLVAELRSTFRARGRVSSSGGLREWVNGNLHACVEPAGAGYRLRLGTLKGDAGLLNALGVGAVAAGTVGFAALALSGGAEAFVVPWALSASGIAALVANYLRLPRWAGERERQIAAIEGRLPAIMDAEPKALPD